MHMVKDIECAQASNKKTNKMKRKVADKDCQYLDGRYAKNLSSKRNKIKSKQTPVLESKENVKRLGSERHHEDTVIEHTKLASDETNLEVPNII